MDHKLLLPMMASLLLIGCSKTSSIDARKAELASERIKIATAPQLTEQDVFGNELTLDISEEDIQNAVEDAQEEFQLPLNSSIVLVRSGARAPDVMMQKEMQKHYQVSTFSGIPVARKKRSIKPTANVKKLDSDSVEDIADNKNNVINANYMQALRYIAAKGRHKAIIVYWDELEAGTYNSATKEMNWRRYTGGKFSGTTLRYLITFALVDVASGEWATYSPVHTEVAVVNSTAKNDITEKKITELKKNTSKMVVEDLIKRYSRVY